MRRARVELSYEGEAAPAAPAGGPVAPLEPHGTAVDDGDDGPHEECGVFAVATNQRNAARVTFFALYALNHRGQESAGIASMDSYGIHVHKGMGLVSQVFTEADITTLAGGVAIGHTRYSTAGGSKLTGAQPFVLETDLGPLAVAHNGQVRRATACHALASCVREARV